MEALWIALHGHEGGNAGNSQARSYGVNTRPDPAQGSGVACHVRAARPSSVPSYMDVRWSLRRTRSLYG